MTEQNQQPSVPKRYVDPNSGAAPQPGGFVASGVKVKSQKQANPPVDPTYDASIEHQAAPQNTQPANPEGVNASESGTSEEGEGGGNLAPPSPGGSEDSSDDDDKPRLLPRKRRH